jgi:hypothetical protein
MLILHHITDDGQQVNPLARLVRRVHTGAQKAMGYKRLGRACRLGPALLHLILKA